MSKLHPDEEMLGLRMVKDHILTEAQLSTAMDFQKAVGGHLKDVILRLKFVEEPKLILYLEETGSLVPAEAVVDQERSPAPGNAENDGKKNEARPEKTVPLPASITAGSALENGDSAPADTAGKAANGFADFAEASIVLEALIRLLVKKGLIEKAEIKEEVLHMDTGSLLESGLLKR